MTVLSSCSLCQLALWGIHPIILWFSVSFRKNQKRLSQTQKSCLAWIPTSSSLLLFWRITTAWICPPTPWKNGWILIFILHTLPVCIQQSAWWCRMQNLSPWSHCDWWRSVRYPHKYAIGYDCCLNMHPGNHTGWIWAHPVSCTPDTSENQLKAWYRYFEPLEPMDAQAEYNARTYVMRRRCKYGDFFVQVLRCSLLIWLCLFPLIVMIGSGFSTRMLYLARSWGDASVKSDHVT